MSVSEHDSLNQAERALIFTPDINDPTAGRVAISREMASEQVRLIADPAPLGLGAFALTTFLLSLANAGIMPAEGRADRLRRGPGLRRDRADPRRHVGVPQEQRLRRHRLHLVRRLLVVVLGLCHVLRAEGAGRAARDRRRLVPDLLGHLHRPSCWSPPCGRPRCSRSCSRWWRSCSSCSASER